MNKQTEQGELINLMDLGDAMLETKQHFPIPPTVQDSTFGMGIKL